MINLILNSQLINRLKKWMPGLTVFLSYKREDLLPDIRAGIAVATVSLPLSIAYAQLTGVDPIVGLYSTILPLFVYALFGSSKQLIIGPDTATCAVIAAVVTPLAMNNSILHWQLIIIATLMIGFWCIIAGMTKMGVLAELLSRPILLGWLNAISISIMVNQLENIFGFSYIRADMFSRLLELPYDLSKLHILTTVISLFSLLMIFLLKKYRPYWPAPLLVIIVGTLLSWVLGLQQYGVNITGNIVVERLPAESWYNFEPGLFRELVIPSMNIAIISFISMMITARSFAAKNNYDIDADNELKALGIANIVAGLSQGFVVSGTSSRTAVNDAHGGKTQLVSVIAGLLIMLVVIFMIDPLQYIPVCALSVILIYSTISLIDVRSIIRFYFHNRDAFLLSITTFISVLLIGVIPGTALAVLLGLFSFLHKTFRPTDQLLGMDDDGHIHGLDGNVKPVKNMLIYRFNSPLTYFNVAYFKRRILTLVDHHPEPVKWVIVDAIPCLTYPDVSVLYNLDELVRSLKLRNIILVLAGRRRTLKRWFNEAGIHPDKDYLEFTYDLYFAVRMYNSQDQMENSNGDSSQISTA